MNQSNILPPGSQQIPQKNEPYGSGETQTDKRFAAQSDSAAQTLAWGLFWRFTLAQSGMLFLVAAVICFFAFNWADMTHFTKFGLIAALMLGAAALPLARGMESAAGNLGLLACGLLAGPLMAVYGQTYQTGADAWELFRAWALFLVPLACIGRQTGLWMALWLVGSLWAGLYIDQRTVAFGGQSEDLVFSLPFALGQIACLAAWEAASHFWANAARGFLYTRWFPRLVAAAVLVLLTVSLSIMIADLGAAPQGAAPFPPLLYCAAIIAGAFWYTRKPDPLMIALGLFSIIVLILVALLSSGHDIFSFGGMLLVTLVLIACAAIAGKILILCHRSVREKEQHNQDTAAAHEEQAAQTRQGSGTARPGTAPGLPDMFSRRALLFALRGPAAHAPRVAQMPLAENTSDTPFGVDTASPTDTGTAGTSATATADTPAATAETSAAVSGAATTTTGASAPDADHDHSSSPWYARFLMGLCAWMATPFLLACFGLLFIEIMSFSTAGMCVISFMLLAAGAGLSRQGGIFLSQSALCLSISGTLGAGFFLADSLDLDTYASLPTALVFLCGYAVVRHNAYRFAAIATAFTLLLINLFIASLQSGIFGAPGETALLLPAAVFSSAVYSAFCLGLVHFWIARLHLEGKSLAAQPLLAGWFTALLVAGLLSQWNIGGEIHRLWEILYFMGFVGICAGIGLMYMVQRISALLGFSSFVRAALTAAAAVVALLSWWMPWLGVGFLCLALARLVAALPLMGLAAAYLAGSVIVEYYSHDTTLLSKSWSLGEVGLALTVAAVLLHRLLVSGVRSHALPFCTNAQHTVQPIRRASFLRSGILAVCAVAFLGMFAWSVQQKEQLLANGRVLILALRPVDPRSLMQGDYMILRFGLEDELEHALQDKEGAPAPKEPLLKGTAVVRAAAHVSGASKTGGSSPSPVSPFPVDTIGAHFVRLDNDIPLAPDETRIVFRSKRWSLQVGSGAFFFQEGHGGAYSKARFAELRVDASGNALITHLLDENGKRIVPEKDKVEEGE